MRIAKWLPNFGHAQNLLPADETAILQLTRLDEDEIAELVEEGTINPNAQRAEVTRQKNLAEHARAAGDDRRALERCGLRNRRQNLCKRKGSTLSVEPQPLKLFETARNSGARGI
jgi:hypothetical protein